MMVRRTLNPDVIQERIIRTQAELRRLKAELRLAEAERRDRERLATAEPTRQEAGR
jgi:hypothetical protein